MRHVAFSIILLFLASTLRCFADDAAMDGEGGAVQLMHGHPTIRMVSELVKAKLPEGKVDATFVFRNEGPATTVTIGFPEEATDYQYNEEPAPETTMIGFRSWVDGELIRTSRITSKFTSGGGFRVWWTKSVRFAAGQTHVIRDRYTGGVYEAGNAGECGFKYILTTGASWHGPIGDAKIIFDVSGLYQKSPIYFQPSDEHRIGDTVVWHERNFEPSRNVVVAWMNDFAAVNVNGKPVWTPESAENRVDPDSWDPKADLDPSYFQWNSDDWGLVTPERKHDDLWLSAKTASKWLGAREIVVQSGRRIIIQRGDRRVAIHVGSSILKSGSSHIHMPGKAGRTTEDGDGDSSPETDDQYTMLYLRPLVTALGGTSTWNATNDRLLITLPSSRP